jgi:dATP pyrophosphohydrolase
MKYIEYVTVLVVRPRGSRHDLLLARRAAGKYLGGTWNLITGGIEPGEPAWRTALRELREETGLVATELYRLSALTQFYRWDNDTLNLSPMFCAIVDAGAVVELNHENSDFAWVPVEEVEPRLLWPGDRAALAEVRSVILGNGIAKPHLRIPLEGAA